jgi:hypothetical protein
MTTQVEIQHQFKYHNRYLLKSSDNNEFNLFIGIGGEFMRNGDEPAIKEIVKQKILNYFCLPLK